MSVAVVTKMKSLMEVGTEVEGANAIKPVMKVPAEFICKESSNCKEITVPSRKYVWLE